MVERLGRRAQFAHLRACGTTVREGQLRVAVVRPLDVADDPRSAVAYSISRRVGTAVCRNRIRRRLRAILATAEREQSLPRGWYLVTVQPSATEPTFGELESWVGSALGRLSDRLQSEQAESTIMEAGSGAG